jgi:hypothetical protein
MTAPQQVRVGAILDHSALQWLKLCAELHGGLPHSATGSGKKLEWCLSAAGTAAATTDGADALAALRPGSIVDSATVAAVHGEVRRCPCPAYLQHAFKNASMPPACHASLHYSVTGLTTESNERWICSRRCALHEYHQASSAQAAD